MFHHIGLSKLLQEALVMSNDNQLEAGVTLAFIDNTATRDQTGTLST